MGKYGEEQTGYDKETQSLNFNKFKVKADVFEKENLSVTLP